MSDDEIEGCFKQKIEHHGLKYGFGLGKGLSKIQKEMKQRLTVGSHKMKSDLRGFGTSSDKVVYKQCKVRKDVFSMLTPVHKYVFPKRKKQMHPSYFAAEVIKFAAACINGRQNGTFHFGIQPLENNEGLIVGLQSSEFRVYTQRIAIDYGLQHCFMGPCSEKRILERTIQPIIFVPCENGSVVIEVDIQPSCLFMKDTAFIVMFPPNGKQEKKLFMYVSIQGWNMFETIDVQKSECLKEDLKNTLELRNKLEQSRFRPNKAIVNKRSALQNRLTAGNTFVTDQMVPHIICGRYTRLENAEKILSLIKSAFVSSQVVFDFDPSTSLIKHIEQGDEYFDIVLPDDENTDEY
ncbi:sterile alpha motif domain-containing protein 9-like [Dreissena polymorpha]|uniref:Uncharacterized protein n=1 Tax=Dreissena polymorpha TaxID=45954 RepID=A0A9D4BN09_DREPO|nr:sterile alpha motif domain-containing protein 9-like [Dreissena polymorpha]KAH3700816.1 hypothetical protein DPMN_075796 [Dreissena polymorpha]